MEHDAETTDAYRRARQLNRCARCHSFAAVVLEENNVTPNAAEAGHQVLNDFVASTLETFVTGIDLQQFNEAVQQRLDGDIQLERDQAIEDELRARFDVVR
jgi:hypothetical protein